MQALNYSAVMKRKLSKTAKLSIFKTSFVSILTYVHEFWVMTEKVRSQVQASEMRFLRRIKGFKLLSLAWVNSYTSYIRCAVLRFENL